MRFIGGMIIGEIHGIALGIAGCVVAVAIAAMLKKEEDKKVNYQKEARARYQRLYEEGLPK